MLRFPRRLWPLALLLLPLLFGCASQRPQELRNAAALGDEETVQAILRNSPDLAGAVDSFQVTPLHFAASRGSDRIVEDLLLAGANPNARDVLGFTPLHWAARGGHLPVVRRLLAAKADAAALSMERWSPLHYALLAHNDRIPNPERIDILRLLIANRADINAAAGRWQVTPLHVAVARGTAAMVAVLLDAGADLGVKDSDGRTPLDECRQRQDAEILRLLQERAAKP